MKNITPEKVLCLWEIYSEQAGFPEHWKERGQAAAANLRGTLKSPLSTGNKIAESLASDLIWYLKKSGHDLI